MTRELMFVHGRSQQHKDPVALKREWLMALRQGLKKSGLELPIGEEDVRFPYYGQTLADLVSGVPADQTAEVVVKGDNAEVDDLTFTMGIVEEIRKKAGITEDQIAEVVGEEVVEKGPLNWGWVQGVLTAVDRFVPFGSGASIRVFTHDVHQYLRNFGIRDKIEMGIRQAIEPGVPTVVVGHSLGSVVSYSLLRREGKEKGWLVPLFVTVGAPLGVKAIKQALAPNKHPECVDRWLNAMDERDVVALYPLTSRYFPIAPEVENKTNVNNHTENRHGIAGYLDDKQVSERIFDALVN